MKLLIAGLLGLLALTARAQVGLPPVIAVQPLGLSVLSKGTATLSVVAVSGTAMTYKWYRNNSIVGGATSSVLTITDANNGDSGTYRVEVKNASGTTISSNATVVVLQNALPVELPIKAAAMNPHGFVIQLDGLAVSRCVIYASTDLVNWSPIATNSVSSGAASYTDTTATSRPYRYYKVMDQ